MRSYSLIAPAKINLYLEILGDRPDGYHELAMILQSIDLADQIDLHAGSTEDIRIHCNHSQVPQDKSNIAYRAANLMAEKFPDMFSNFGGIDITITKNIPVAAGLAGGSTDAAAVLVGIDLLWNLGLTKLELEQLAAEIGSDVPFCISGGTVIATGRGEKLAPLPGLDNVHLVLAKYRSLEISTAWAYKTYRQVFGSSYINDQEELLNRANAVNLEETVKAVLAQDTAAIGQTMHNDLEKVVLPAYLKVSKLRELFANQAEVLGTMMSGSGPSVFAIVESPAQGELVKDKIRSEIPDPDLELFVTKTITHGIQILT